MRTLVLQGRKLFFNFACSERCCEDARPAHLRRYKMVGAVRNDAGSPGGGIHDQRR